MSLTVDQVRRLARAWVNPDPGERARALTEICGPAPDRLAEAAAAHLDDPDRNVRVAALRVLAFADGEAAVEGILRGLDDPMKRVRGVAAKSSARFVKDPRVVARLRRAVEENDRGSSWAALGILSGIYQSPYGLSALEPVADALAALARSPAYRQKVLSALLRARTLTDETAEILRDFVRDGSKEEAVHATRRLCGYRVAHHGELTDDERRRAERAWGRVWYWVRSE